MTDTSFRGTALYNPQLASPDSLVHDFVARRRELATIVDDLRSRRNAAPQHHLILGQRGMGKSTLLQRIAVELTRDAELHAAYLPLVLPEEQYNVKYLGDLWLNALDALSDALEREGRADDVARIDAAVGQIPPKATPENEASARSLLLQETARLGRKLVLLVDNLDLVLSRVGKQDWTLREVLQGTDRLVLIGASAAAMESTYTYGQAFYDFFVVHRLAGLTDEEATEVLLAIADRQQNAEVRRIVTGHPERVRPIRLFAGGNPRTIVLLYEVVAAGPEQDLRGILEALLDRYTPLYKARVEALAPQAQQVVDALCTAWDPAMASELAESTGLDVNTVSTQLGRLVDDGVVEKVSSYDRRGRPRKKAAFQVGERFFNIWYMMRLSRRARQKLTWFVRAVAVLEGADGVVRWGRALLTTPSPDPHIIVAFLDHLQGSLRTQLLWRVAPLVADTDLDYSADFERARAVTNEVGAIVAAWDHVLEKLAQSHSDFEANGLSPARSILLLRDARRALATSTDEDLLAAIVFAVRAHERVLRKVEPAIDFEPLAQLGLASSDPEFFAHLVEASSRDDALLVLERIEDLGISVLQCIGLLTFSNASVRQLLERVAAAKTEPRTLAGAWNRTVSRLYLDGPEAALHDAKRCVALMDERSIPHVAVFPFMLPRLVFEKRSADLVVLLDDSGLGASLRPLREALHAHAVGTRDALLALAPEVREVAERIYDDLTPPAPSPAPTPASPRPAR